MNALLALVDSLGALPGRKTVVYFCEGLTVAPAVEAKFRSIIATANRKNVSVYALDAAGLRAHSKQAETAREISSLAASAVSGHRARATTRSGPRTSRVNEQMLKMDPSASLGILTAQTGGLLIQNTNDLDAASARSTTTAATTTRSPTPRPTRCSTARTGRIEVKVKRPGVDVRRQERVSGGAGQRGLAGADLRSPRRWPPSPPRRGPTRSPCNRARSACRCRAVSASRRSSPRSRGEAVTFAEDPKTKTYAGDAVVLARVTDGAGTPMAKQSQQYQLTGSLDDLAKVKAGQLGVLPHAGSAARTVHRHHRRPRPQGQAIERRRERRGGAWRDHAGRRVAVHHLACRTARSEGPDRRVASAGGPGRPALPVAWASRSARRRRPRLPLRCRCSSTRQRPPHRDAGTAAGWPGAGADSAAARQARRHGAADSNQQAAFGRHSAGRRTSSV